MHPSHSIGAASFSTAAPQPFSTNGWPTGQPSRYPPEADPAAPIPTSSVQPNMLPPHPSSGAAPAIHQHRQYQRRTTSILQFQKSHSEPNLFQDSSASSAPKFANLQISQPRAPSPFPNQVHAVGNGMSPDPVHGAPQSAVRMYQQPQQNGIGITDPASIDRLVHAFPTGRGISEPPIQTSLRIPNQNVSIMPALPQSVGPSSQQMVQAMQISPVSIEPPFPLPSANPAQNNMSRLHSPSALPSAPQHRDVAFMSSESVALRPALVPSQSPSPYQQPLMHINRPHDPASHSIQQTPPMHPHSHPQQVPPLQIPPLAHSQLPLSNQPQPLVQSQPQPPLPPLPPLPQTQYPAAQLVPQLPQQQPQPLQLPPQPLQHVGSSQAYAQMQHYFHIPPLAQSDPSLQMLSVYGLPYVSQPLMYAHLMNGTPSFNQLTAGITQMPGQGANYIPYVYQLPMGISAPSVGVVSGVPVITRKEYFDYFLQMAHQKYGAQDYRAALALLQELYTVQPEHLPTLLLLGCTCYSLNMHDLSIFYNNLILNIDPQFSEAYSNLGTTYRGIAIAKGPQTLVSGTGQTALELAEQFYRIAISIRPKYWDASINLAGLLGGHGRCREAVEVYDALESLMEQEFPAEYRMERSCIINSSEVNDAELCRRISEIEAKRRDYIKQQRLQGLGSPGEASGYTDERRRELFYARGNLLYAMKEIFWAKVEYYKGLSAVGIDVGRILKPLESTHGGLPPPIITPGHALALLQKSKQGQVPGQTQPLNQFVPSLPVLALPQQPQAQAPTSASASGLDPVMYHPTTALIFQTLAKIHQDFQQIPSAALCYYMSLAILPTANNCNNLGIILAPQRLQESIQWYEVGLNIDPSHVHLYTNLGSALKDFGQIQNGIACYQQAIALQPDFYIALANLANVFKDLGKVDDAIGLYRRALAVKPDFVEAFCNYVNSLLFICEWQDRSENLMKIKSIVQKQLLESRSSYPRTVPTVLPFHTFTYSSLTSWMVREIARRNAERTLYNVTSSDWFPGFPQRPGRYLLPQSLSQATSEHGILQSLHYPYPYSTPPPPFPHIRVGYLSSDFNNHPLAHLMQSVFGMHNRGRFRVYCYSLSPHDGSPYRAKIEAESDYFVDVSMWSVKDIVERIVSDGIHILCNLNGYTKGGKNEVFAARPAPIQMAFMGFAGTMGGGPVESGYVSDHEGFSNPGDDYGIREDARDAENQRQRQALTHTELDDIFSNADPAFFDDLSGEKSDHAEFFENVAERWIDYMVVDEIACPRRLVCAEPLPQRDIDNDTGCIVPADNSTHHLRGPVQPHNDANRIYLEGLVYLPQTYFVNDHRQGFREEIDAEVLQLVRENGESATSEIEGRVKQTQDLISASQQLQYGVEASTIVAAVEAPPASVSQQIQQQLSDVVHREKMDHLEAIHAERLDDPDQESLTPEERHRWTVEQILRLKGRRELFPQLDEQTVIFANFNQLYKIDPEIFKTWMQILKRVPNSVLWLLRFPPAGEPHLKRKAVELVGEEVAQRLVFTDVAPKHIHIHRGRIADIFLDTPECNAHTTAADILWSGTPLITYPKYDFKMCSRVAASISYATGTWNVRDPHGVPHREMAEAESLLGQDRTSTKKRCNEGIKLDLKRLKDPHLLGHLMVVNSYEEYADQAVMLARSVKWRWRRIAGPKGLGIMQDDRYHGTDVSNLIPLPSASKGPMSQCLTSLAMLAPSGLLVRLRRRLFLTRDIQPLFDTNRWVRGLEAGMELAMDRWNQGWSHMMEPRNHLEFKAVMKSGIGSGRLVLEPSAGSDGHPDSNEVLDLAAYRPDVPKKRMRLSSRCLWVNEDGL